MTRNVFNLRTNEERVYSGISAEQAVIAAYAQARNDNNTQNYTRYRRLVTFGKVTVACGDWCCFRDKTE